VSKQYIEGADFSLERFTDSVPQDGRYYILKDSQIAAVFDSQEEAQAYYKRLCLSYWTRMLGSDDLTLRLQAARGLLRRDRTHRPALETLATYGDSRESSYAAESLRRLERQQAAATTAEA